MESRSAGFTVWSSTEGLLAGVWRSVSGQVHGQSRQFFRGKGRSLSRRGGDSKGPRSVSAVLQIKGGSMTFRGGDSKGPRSVFGGPSDGRGEVWLSEGCSGLAPLGHMNNMGPGVDIDSHITTEICKTPSIYTSLDKKGPYPFMSFHYRSSQIELEFREAGRGVCWAPEQQS